jgi:hypothetical protein
MLLLTLAVSSSCCLTWLNESNPVISNDAEPNGCAQVRRCYFASLSRKNGGAIYLNGFSDINVSDCTFRSCTATNSMADTYGGACDLGSTRFSFARCCGVSCWSETYGQFLFIVGTGVTGGLSASDHAVSEVTAVTCEDYSCDYGTVYLESPVSASFRDVNITKCVVLYDGAALYAESGTERYTASYFHVEGCHFANTIVTNCRADFPTLDHANFYGNAPLGDARVLFGNPCGMALRYCVFSGNSGDLIYATSQKFNLDFCYFLDSGPSTSYADVGPNCVSNFATASYGVSAINTRDCPAIPRATASQFFTFSFVFERSHAIACSPRFSVSAIAAARPLNGISKFEGRDKAESTKGIQ